MHRTVFREFSDALREQFVPLDAGANPHFVSRKASSALVTEKRYEQTARFDQQQVVLEYEQP